MIPDITLTWIYRVFISPQALGTTSQDSVQGYIDANSIGLSEHVMSG